jgi:polyphosphate kinase
MLKILLGDNVKAQIMQPDGTYERIDRRGKVLLCAQDYFTEAAKEYLKKIEKKDENSRVFIPAEPK